MIRDGDYLDEFNLYLRFCSDLVADSRVFFKNVCYRSNRVIQVIPRFM